MKFIIRGKKIIWEKICRKIFENWLSNPFSRKSVVYIKLHIKEFKSLNLTGILHKSEKNFINDATVLIIK